MRLPWLAGKNANAGLTLIEILIVVGIIGLLLGVVLTVAGDSRRRSQTAHVVSVSGQVNRVMGAYCVGRWAFDEGSGTSTIDDCPTPQNGTINGATWVTGPNSDQALDFDGVDDVVQAIGLPALGTLWTLEAMIYPHTVAGHDIFISRTLPYLSRNGDSIVLSWTNTSGTQASLSAPANSLEVNKWYHVVGTHDGTTARILINNVEVASSAVGTQSVAAGNWDIGRQYNDNSYAWDGYLDNVRIYNEKLK